MKLAQCIIAVAVIVATLAAHSEAAPMGRRGGVGSFVRTGLSSIAQSAVAGGAAGAAGGATSALVQEKMFESKKAADAQQTLPITQQNPAVANQDLLPAIKASQQPDDWDQFVKDCEPGTVCRKGDVTVIKDPKPSA